MDEAPEDTETAHLDGAGGAAAETGAAEGSPRAAAPAAPLRGGRRRGTPNQSYAITAALVRAYFAVARERLSVPDEGDVAAMCVHLHTLQPAALQEPMQLSTFTAEVNRISSRAETAEKSRRKVVGGRQVSSSVLTKAQWATFYSDAESVAGALQDFKTMRPRPPAAFPTELLDRFLAKPFAPALMQGQPDATPSVPDGGMPPPTTALPAAQEATTAQRGMELIPQPTTPHQDPTPSSSSSGSTYVGETVLGGRQVFTSALPAYRGQFARMQAIDQSLTGMMCEVAYMGKWLRAAMRDVWTVEEANVRGHLSPPQSPFVVHEDASGTTREVSGGPSTPPPATPSHSAPAAEAQLALRVTTPGADTALSAPVASQGALPAATQQELLSAAAAPTTAASPGSDE